MEKRNFLKTGVFTMVALCGAASAFAGIEIAPIDTSADRVKTPLKVDMKRIGTIRPRSVSEIRDSNWTLGCETIERGYADFWQYADYIAPLGIKTIRIHLSTSSRNRYGFNA